MEEIAIMKSLKRIIIIGIFLLVMICGGIYIVHMKLNVGYDAAITLACTGLEYEEKSNNSYLSFAIDTPDGSIIKTIRVDSSEMEKNFTSVNVQEIIGLLIFLELPNQIISEGHFNTQTINALELLTHTDMYDSYFRIVDYSTK